MVPDFHFENVKRISPGFWAAIATAAAAGATIFAGNRVLAGLGFGAGMFLVALKLTPCCDGCAQGKGCGGASDDAPTSAESAPRAPRATGGLDDASPMPSVIQTRGLRVVGANPVCS